MRNLLAASAFTVVISAAIIPTVSFAAIEAQKVSDAVVAKLQNNGWKVTIGSAELSGSNVTLKDVELSPQAKDDKPIKLSQIELENVVEDGSGYKVGQVMFPANTLDDGKGGILKLEGGSIKGVTLAGPGETDPIRNLFLYESVEVAPVSYTLNGAEVFHLGGATATMTPYAAGQPLNFDAAVKDIHGSFASVTDPKVKEGLATLGISEISGMASFKGSWNPSDGRLALTEESIDFANLGKINLAIDVSGYTADFLKGMAEVNKTMGDKDAKERGQAMMGMMSQLTLNSISLRFDDASLTGRIIDLVAKQTGQPKDAILAQAKGMVPFMLMQLQNPEFATAATTAISAYLDSPKNIEIKAAPAAALPFAAIAATAMSQPGEAIKQINLTVTANQ